MKLKGQMPRGDIGAVLKGVSRRVVVVEPKHQDLFEQAIFLVRDTPMTKKQVLREACRIAQQYQDVPRKTRTRGLALVVVFAAGLCIGALTTAAILFWT